MPGGLDRMELQKVSTEGDDDSNNSLDDTYQEKASDGGGLSAYLAFSW